VSDSSGSSKKAVVLKVGGSVLTGVKAFRRVASFLKHRSELTPSEKLVVVVSAQKFETDRLKRQARRIVRAPGVRALDLLWSTGELRSVALLALHLESLEVSSVGLNVHEMGLQFASDHQEPPTRFLLRERQLEAAVSRHAVVVVPGFLATRLDGAVVSLGRGGSDLSAVLLATGLKAVRCELVKDVPGYFEDDPHENPRTLHLPSLSFDDAVQMADKGCELVERRALLAAAEAGLPLLIRSIDERGPFTVIASSSKNGSVEFRDETVAAQA
jgi:aspartate kinase